MNNVESQSAATYPREVPDRESPDRPVKAWTTICRRHSELRLPNGLTLQQWAERGRLVSDDYVFDRRLDTWVRACDLDGLGLFFRRRAAQRVTRVIWLLSIVALMAFFAAPALAEVFLVAAGLLSLHARTLARERRRESPARS